MGGEGIAIQAAMAVQQAQSSMFLLYEAPMGGKGMAAKGKRDVGSLGMTGMQAILRGSQYGRSHTELWVVKAINAACHRKLCPVMCAAAYRGCLPLQLFDGCAGGARV